MEFPVLLEDTGEIVTLTLSKNDYERANKDENFLRCLIEKQGEQKKRVTIPNIVNTGKLNTSESYTWGDDSVHLLLEVYRNKQIEFSQNKRHNRIWTEIATEINTKNLLLNVTGLQCATKVSGLKRTYKNIKDQNKKSGNCRSSWAFFSVMDSIFGEKAYIEPVAIASSEGPSSSFSFVKNSENKIFSSSEEENKLDMVATKPPEKKRRVEILNNYIDNFKNIMDERDKEKREEKALREMDKQKRYEKKRLDKQRMHADKMAMHESMLGLLKSFIERDKEK
ncbi:unnamed protein product [Lasius platythorax]|uniref:Myb/SANT-like DNA-binding domain-containing protein n=1 Tax=Lasius platythorax TaxID=488582 RepID=A0AAV2P830_9HYME